MELTSDQLVVQRYNKIVLVTFQRDRILDGKVINAIGDDLAKLADINPKISLILDMHNVTAMSSQMLGKLVAVNKTILKMKGRMALTNVQSKVKTLFTVTKLNRVIKIESDSQKLLLYWQRKPL